MLLLSSLQVTAGETYEEFERHLDPQKHGLIVDLDMQASFAANGNEVVFRKGEYGHGQILLADPGRGVVRPLVDEAGLRAALSAAGAPAGNPRIVRYQSERELLVVAIDEGAHWTYAPKTGKVSKQEESRVQESQLSPDGMRRLFVRDYNLWIEDVGARESASQLTRDGSYDRRYAINYPHFGEQARNNSELPPMRVEAHWSPDSRYALTYRLDRNGATIHEGIQEHPPGAGPPRRFRHVYPNAGAKLLPQLQPVLIDLAEGGLRELGVPAQELVSPTSPPLWWEQGRAFYRWSARGFGQTRLFEIDPGDGSVRLRVHESIAPVVDPNFTKIRRAPELGGTIIVSERSGWAQLYLLEDGGDPAGGRRLTSGEWEISEVLNIAKDGILVTGTGREPGVHPYYEQLYRVGLDGSLARLTPESVDHKVEISSNGKWFIDRMSTPAEPTRTLIRSAVDGRIVMELGRADPSPLLADGDEIPEMFQGLSADGRTSLYALIHRPPNFDATRKYPVIESVYTGPHRHRIREDYARTMAGIQSALTRLGAVVVLIDAQGTAGRGREFRMPAYANLHEVGIDDRVAMLKQMQARYPAMDIDRGVGVIGGSAGGYDVFRFMARRPDIYTVGVSQSGNHDLRLEKASWPERFMGLADDAVWKANANTTYAGLLQGKLLLVHGDLDDNVPVATTQALSKALDDAGKKHELMILPNVGHFVRTTDYYRAVQDFFLRELIHPGPGLSTGLSRPDRPLTDSGSR